MTCKYKDIFGKPGKGVHSVRVFDVAVVDLGLTILAGYYLAKYFRWDVYWTILGLLVIGEISHAIFCVETTFLKVLKKLISS
jgi:hypothetical protein